MSRAARDSAGREVTMRDVARRAGVSIATVSRALHGVAGVSPATSERIHRIADELSYVISPEASALAGGHTGRVAVVVPQLDTWLHGALLASMAPVLTAAGLEMLVYQVSGGEQRARFLRELPTRRKADAVIVAALPLAPAELDRLDLLGVHLVVTGGTASDHPHVGIDEYETGRLAVQHLLDLGHRRIAMIRTDDVDDIVRPSDVQRVAAWREARAGAGLDADDELLASETYDAEAGARAMARLLALHRPPTAVFAYSDELAVAAVSHLRSTGRRVPEDVSVVGVDGHPLGEVVGLTTVDQDVVGQGQRTADLVVRLIAGEPVLDVVVPVRLVERRSTAPPRA